jgi:Protein of unknown function (DUF2721)
VDTLETSQLVTVLQTAVGPVVVISGVGLLLLTMTNRLGRIVDRSRALSQQARTSSGEEREKARAQLRILRERAELTRWAIGLAAFCVLFVALLVISLFVTALFGVEVAWLIAGFFIVSMGCLIASLVMFIRDINKALHATALEVGEEWQKK